MTTFADTSALYAVLDADDAFHERARVAWRSMLTDDEPIVTTNYVVVETFALAQLSRHAQTRTEVRIHI